MRVSRLRSARVHEQRKAVAGVMPGSEISAEQAPGIGDYIEVLRRRKLIILFFTCLVVGAALAYTFARIPVHESEAVVLVRPFKLEAESDAAPEDVDLETEALVATSPPVAKMAAENIDVADATNLLDNLTVSAAPDTSVLSFKFVHRDPQEAALRAQAFADAYVANRTTQLQTRIETVASSLQDQIHEFQKRLDGIQARIAASKGEPTATLKSKANTLGQQIVFERTKLLSLASSSTLDVGHVLFPAETPTTSAGPTTSTNLMLALLVGLTGGVGVAFLREQLDERLSGRSDLESASGVPVLALVPRVAVWNRAHEPYLVTREEPQSVVSEAYRTLRTAVLFTASQTDTKTLMVTSAHEQEGKTTTSANLAVVLGQAGKQIVLISADLRRPRLQSFFGVDPREGLTSVLAGEAKVSEMLQSVGEPSLNVRLLPSGRVPGNPAELLSSDAMADLLEELRDSADFVLVDSAPVLAVADAMIVARACDGVILVADGSKTSREAVHQACVQLRQVDANLIGSVLHNFDTSKADTYGSRSPTSYSYESEKTTKRVRAPAFPKSRQKG